jgi:hypothetical protein
MTADEGAMRELSLGPLYPFAHWPNELVPRHAAGVYSVWQDTDLVYVGMAGRGMNAETIESQRSGGRRSLGLYDRLDSHASGRRSGDQFCLYVADRLVLPSLDREAIAGIASGTLALDAVVKRYVHERLAYRFVVVPDGRTASELERRVRRGALAVGRPLLNPL